MHKTTAQVMLAIKVAELTEQVAPCRFSLKERIIINSEAIRRGTFAEFLETDDGEQLVAIGDPRDDYGFAVGRNPAGGITVASMRTGKAVCTGNTVAWAMTTWRALG